MKKKKKKPVNATKSECLDIVAAVHQNSIYPLIFCHMQIKGTLDFEKLIYAIHSSSMIVPEILYVYDLEQGYFIEQGFTAHDVLLEQREFPQGWKWDLSNDTQLKIIVYPEHDGLHIIIGISHILCDGNGFLQYLYLLADLYNGNPISSIIKNDRNIAPYLKKIRIGKNTEQTRVNRRKIFHSLRFTSDGTTPFCLYETINIDDLRKLKEKAVKYQSTLNDVFLSAYARVLAKLQHVETVKIPCPVDLRRFRQEREVLTIGNFTGIFRKIPIEIKKNVTFTETLQQVHFEMELQKAHLRCFIGIPALYTAHRIMPLSIIRTICKMTYHVASTSYSNIGVIDDTKLSFSDCEIETCFITGSYRMTPDFQLSISTFKNECTLNCTIIGDNERKEKCQEILNLVKDELLSWIKE